MFTDEKLKLEIQIEDMQVHLYHELISVATF